MGHHKQLDMLFLIIMIAYKVGGWIWPVKMEETGYDNIQIIILMGMYKLWDIIISTIGIGQGVWIGPIMMEEGNVINWFQLLL